MADQETIDQVETEEPQAAEPAEAAGDESPVAEDNSAQAAASDESAQAEDSAESPHPDPENGAPYDFTRPWTVSNKFNHNLRSIAEAFANQVSFSMTNYMRSGVDASFKSVKQELFQDHLASLPERSCMGVFSFEPIKGQCVLTVDANVMFVIMDKLVGGAGGKSEIDRDFTEIETRVFMVIMGKLLSDLKEAAKKYFDARESLSRIENSTAFVAVMTPAERVMTMRLQMQIGEAEGDVVVAMPMFGFDPVMSALDPPDESMLRRADIPPEDLERIHSALDVTHVDVAAVIGAARISLSRLMEMEVGDTIILEQRVTDPIPLMAGRVVLGHGEPGKSQNRKALKLVSGVATEVAP